MKLRGLTFVLISISTVGAALGCSDPVPTPAQGNFRLLLESTTDRPDGSKCQDPFLAGLPSTPDAQPTVGDAGTRLIDGDGGARIKCTVTKSGDGFRVRGTVALGPTKLFLDFENVPADGSGEGYMSIGAFGLSLTSNLGDEFGDEFNKPCNLTPIDIKEGALWATFNCPGIGAAPANYCAVSDRGGDQGIVVLENCG